MFKQTALYIDTLKRNPRNVKLNFDGSNNSSIRQLMDFEITTPESESIFELKSKKIDKINTRSLSLSASASVDRCSMGSLGLGFISSKATIVFHFENTLASVVESLAASLKKSHFDHTFKVKVKSSF